jgi:hypothetical protein
MKPEILQFWVNGCRLDHATIVDYDFGSSGAPMRPVDNKALQSDILLGFWKIHTLHYIGEEPLVGDWMIHGLHRHRSGHATHPAIISWRIIDHAD